MLLPSLEHVGMTKSSRWEGRASRSNGHGNKKKKVQPGCVFKMQCRYAINRSLRGKEKEQVEMLVFGSEEKFCLALRSTSDEAMGVAR